jgi:hypothetical protein
MRRSQGDVKPPAEEVSPKSTFCRETPYWDGRLAGGPKVEHVEIATAAGESHFISHTCGRPGNETAVREEKAT